MSDLQDGFGPNPIAVVGMACRFPGASTVDAFWNDLCAGRESIRTLQPAELSARGVSARLFEDPRFVPRVASCEHLEQFDPSPFKLALHEAQLLDPQQRVMLECTLEALEHAACDPERVDGSVGVYVGAAMSSYLFHLLSHPSLVEQFGETVLRHANDKDYLAAQLSYRFDLRGPSVCVQSGCSTGAVAIHSAAQALLAGECDLAVAGAVSIRVPAETGYLHRPNTMLSPDGHCRVFDARASGTVYANGGGVLVLRRLADALDARDPICAVIVGSAVNNAGALRPSWTAPGFTAQRAVAEEALALASLEAGAIGYVEAHGAATVLGDAVEVKALAEAFGGARPHQERIPIGCVKSNVGHLGTASAMAGVIKAILCVSRGAIPASLGVDVPNPELDLESSPFRVCSALEPFVAVRGPRRAAVHSYGMTGTNAHIIVAQPPDLLRRSASRGTQPRLFVLSAQTDWALDRTARSLADRLISEPNLEPDEVAYTLAAGRRQLARRRAVVARDLREAAAWLLRERPVAPRAISGLAWFYPSRIDAVERLERTLCESSPLVRRVHESIVECAPGVRGPDAATLAMQLTLTEVWRTLGSRPDYLAGIGVGELAAACAAGVLRFEDALALACPDCNEDGTSTAQVCAREVPLLPFYSRALGQVVATATDVRRWFGKVVRHSAHSERTVERSPWDTVPDVGVIFGTQQTAAGFDGLAGELILSLGLADEPARGLLEAIATLWQRGADLDTSALYDPTDVRRLALPGSVFDRQRCFIEPAPESPLCDLGQRLAIGF